MHKLLLGCSWISRLQFLKAHSIRKKNINVLLTHFCFLRHLAVREPPGPGWFGARAEAGTNDLPMTCMWKSISFGVGFQDRKLGMFGSSFIYFHWFLPTAFFVPALTMCMATGAPFKTWRWAPRPNVDPHGAPKCQENCGLKHEQWGDQTSQHVGGLNHGWKMKAMRHPSWPSIDHQLTINWPSINPLWTPFLLGLKPPTIRKAHKLFGPRLPVAWASPCRLTLHPKSVQNTMVFILFSCNIATSNIKTPLVFMSICGLISKTGLPLASICHIYSENNTFWTMVSWLGRSWENQSRSSPGGVAKGVPSHWAAAAGEGRGQDLLHPTCDNKIYINWLNKNMEKLKNDPLNPIEYIGLDDFPII